MCGARIWFFKIAIINIDALPHSWRLVSGSQMKWQEEKKMMQRIWNNGKHQHFFSIWPNSQSNGRPLFSRCCCWKKLREQRTKKNKNNSDQVYSHILSKNVRQANWTNLQTHQNDATRHQQNIQLIKQITTIKTNEMETRTEKICSARMEWTNISNRFKTQFARQFIASNRTTHCVAWHGMAQRGVVWRGGLTWRHEMRLKHYAIFQAIRLDFKCRLTFCIWDSLS